MPAFAVPSNIRDELTSRYEYVVAEKEIVPDLTDTLRNCDTCSKWCPPYVLHTCSFQPLAAQPSTQPSTEDKKPSDATAASRSSTWAVCNPH